MAARPPLRRCAPVCPGSRRPSAAHGPRAFRASPRRPRIARRAAALLPGRAPAPLSCRTGFYPDPALSLTISIPFLSASEVGINLPS